MKIRRLVEGRFETSAACFPFCCDQQQLMVARRDLDPQPITPS